MGDGGTTTSGIFACNLDAVDATAKQLDQVYDELQNFSRRDDSQAGDLASAKIQNALQDFYDDSSDQREKITDAVKGLRDILKGLAQGVRDVDSSLAGALADPQAPGPAAQAVGAG
jgi:uncharacterized protein YukE